MPTRQSTKVKARRWIEEVEERIAKGKVGIQAPGMEKTFAEAMAYWLENHSATALSSHGDNVSRSKELLEVLGTLTLSEINAERVVVRRASAPLRTKGGKKVPRWAVGTINRHLALLRKVLNDSARWGWITAAPKVQQPETDFADLKKDEAERFLRRRSCSTAHTRFGW